jgi:hypothetical protein
MSYLRQLVQSTLRPTKRPASMMHPELEVGLFGQASATGARAVAYGGAGLDLAGGECLLAGIGSHQSERGFEHRLAAAITNRRTIVGGWSSVKGVLNDVRAWVMHDEVLGLDAKTGLVSAKFDVHTPRGPVKLVHLYGHCPEVEAFFRGLQQIPIGHRGEPPMPMPGPSAEDPLGVQAALASLWWPDERAQTLLHALHSTVAAGAIDPASAADLVGRVQLAHRAMCSGPAASGSAFLSPLSSDDFGNVLVGALGQPMSYQSPQPGLHWLDFRLDPRRDAIGGALKALGIASFIGLGIGFSPGGMIAAEIMKKQPVQAIRFVYADAPGGCAYEMHANGRRLEHGEAEMAHAIHQLLLHAAWPVLERRCHVGWHQPYAQLFAQAAHG